jgi:hypothetical protein
MTIHKAIPAFLMVVSISLASVNESAGRAWRPALPVVVTANVLQAMPLQTPYYDEAYEIGGYGEYAEYGPWAHSNRFVPAGCYPARAPIWAVTGWLFRRILVCR